MSNGTPLDPHHPLTPSEVVFLNGEQFARKARLIGMELLHTDQKVSIAELGYSILAAAFLGAEKSGALRFEVQKKKALLGLRTVDVLGIKPGSPATEWAPDTLEGNFSELTKKLAQTGNVEVYNVVYTWLGSDSSSPWGETIERLKANMARRELLDRHEEKKLKIFTTTSYTLPEGTRALAKQQPVSPTRSLLENCQQNRAELWRLLEKGIKKAISDRTERSDSDTMDFD